MRDVKLGTLVKPLLILKALLFGGKINEKIDKVNTLIAAIDLIIPNINMTFYKTCLLLCIGITLITSYPHDKNLLKNITSASIIKWESADCAEDCVIMLNDRSNIAYNLNELYFIQSNDSMDLSWELYCLSKSTNCSDFDINVIQIDSFMLNLTAHHVQEKVIIKDDGLLLECVGITAPTNEFDSYTLVIVVESDSTSNAECLTPALWTITPRSFIGIKLGLIVRPTLYNPITYRIDLKSFAKNNWIFVQNRCKGSTITITINTKIYGTSILNTDTATQPGPLAEPTFIIICIIIFSLIFFFIIFLIYYFSHACKESKQTKTDNSSNNMNSVSGSNASLDTDTDFNSDSDSDFDISLDNIQHV